MDTTPPQRQYQLKTSASDIPSQYLVVCTEFKIICYPTTNYYMTAAETDNTATQYESYFYF